MGKGKKTEKGRIYQQQNIHMGRSEGFGNVAKANRIINNWSGAKILDRESPDKTFERINLYTERTQRMNMDGESTCFGHAIIVM